MNLEQLWDELESTIAPGQHHGRRRLPSDRQIDVNITVTQPGPLRGLALTVADEALAGVGDLPATREIEHLRRPAAQSGRTSLELRLTDPSASQLFVALAGDVARAVLAAPDEHDAVGLWLNRVHSWRRLLASAPRGLSPERQRGLYGELDVLRHEISSRVGIEAAVDGWQGPLGGHDFQLVGGAFEVKASAAHAPQIAQISSERQLDETGTDGLHLIHLSLDIHQHAGESLPDLVAEVRGLAASTAVEALLAERLVDAGYIDAHEAHYLSTGYTVRERQMFRVGPGFPRIIETDLADGVGAVQYQLVISACADFMTTPDVTFGPLGRPG